MNAALNDYVRTAHFFSEALPKSYGIVLYDLEKKGLPVLFEKNVTGTARDAARKCIKAALTSETVVENGMLLNRGDASSRDRLRKLSVYFIKDESGTPVGALALLMELTDFLSVSVHLKELLTFDTNDIADIKPIETPKDTKEIGLDSIEAFILNETDDPTRLTPDEKTELILDLYDMGAFSVKGSVMKAATVLHMSEQSVYRYIAKIKRLRGE